MIKVKKNIFYVLLSLFLYCITSYSQTNNSENKTESSFPGKLALQFAVGSNFTVQSLDGLMFALKYNFSDKSALRFGIEFVGSSNNEILTTPYSSIPSPNNNENITFISSFLFYLKSKTNFNIYFGTGPRVSYSHKLEGIDYKSNSWSAGLQLNIGVEWFALKQLGFFAEYSAYGTYGKTHTQEKECRGGICGNYDMNTTDLVFNGTTARLGISVYF